MPLVTKWGLSDGIAPPTQPAGPISPQGRAIRSVGEASAVVYSPGSGSDRTIRDFLWMQEFETVVPCVTTRGAVSLGSASAPSPAVSFPPADGVPPPRR